MKTKATSTNTYNQITLQLKVDSCAFDIGTNVDIRAWAFGICAFVHLAFGIGFSVFWKMEHSNNKLKYAANVVLPAAGRTIWAIADTVKK